MHMQLASTIKPIDGITYHSSELRPQHKYALEPQQVLKEEITPIPQACTLDPMSRKLTPSKAWELTSCYH